MAPNTRASLDTWLAEADRVLDEQRERALSPTSGGPWSDGRIGWTVSLATLEAGLPGLLGKLCARPGRWALIAEDGRNPRQFWQVLAFEDGSLLAEVVSNTYLEGPDRWTPAQEDELRALGWQAPNPPADSTNWWREEVATSPPLDDVAALGVASLRGVFGLGSGDGVAVTLFGLAERGDTPATSDRPAEGHDQTSEQAGDRDRVVLEVPGDATDEELEVIADEFVAWMRTVQARHERLVGGEG